MRESPNDQPNIHQPHQLHHLLLQIAPLLRLLAVADGRTVRKQRSASRSRALSVRDDEEGHLICRSGDVLQERCTHCHYSIVTISEYSIYMTWECLMIMMMMMMMMTKPC